MERRELKKNSSKTEAQDKRTLKTEDNSSKTEAKDKVTSKSEDSQGEKALMKEEQGGDHSKRSRSCNVDHVKN